jgi:hypothetical protein
MLADKPAEKPAAEARPAAPIRARKARR